MLRDSSACEELSRLVREVVAVVVQQVIPATRCSAIVEFKMAPLDQLVVPVPPEPISALSLQVLHEHPCIYLCIAHLGKSVSSCD